MLCLLCVFRGLSVLRVRLRRSQRFRWPEQEQEADMAGRRNFEAYEIALEILRELRGVLLTIKKHDRELEKQGRRAATSVASLRDLLDRELAMVWRLTHPLP